MKVMREQNKLFQAGFVHGIPVNISNMEQALVEVETLISFREHHYVCFLRAIFLSVRFMKKMFMM